MSFWHDLPLPIVGLSPMDGVTDHPFRHITKKYGQPAVIYTEFTSVEGVCHGASRLLEDFLFDETQRPIIAQIYGTTPEFFRQTATILCELGFDGIDINMGCPAKNVAHSGAGAALITTPQLAQDIVRATKAGIADFWNGKRARSCQDVKAKIWREVERRHQLLPSFYQPEQNQTQRDIPVSVKTRIGFNEVVIEDWITTLLEVEPAAITVHGRTLKQQYSGQANWEEIAKGAELIRRVRGSVRPHFVMSRSTFNSPSSYYPYYLGNGDVASYDDALSKVATYGVDGVLIGRATFGNPFVFHTDEWYTQNSPSFRHQNTTPLVDLTIVLEHAKLFADTYQDHDPYSFLPMRKHLGWYVRGIPNATDIRAQLFQTNTPVEVESILRHHLAWR